MERFRSSGMSHHVHGGIATISEKCVPCMFQEHLLDFQIIKKEAAHTSKMSVTISHLMQFDIPKDFNLQGCCCVNLKPKIILK